MLEHFLTPPDQYHNLLILNSIYFLASPLILHVCVFFCFQVYSTFNRAGLCSSYKSTLNTIDRICESFDSPVKHWAKKCPVRVRLHVVPTKRLVHVSCIEFHMNLSAHNWQSVLMKIARSLFFLNSLIHYRPCVLR